MSGGSKIISITYDTYGIDSINAQVNVYPPGRDP